MPHQNDTLFSPPPVYAVEADIEALRALAAMAGTSAPGASLYRQEFERLSILTDDRAPFIVRLGSTVTYRDLRTKRERTVEVVRPDRADSDENRVSVLSPIGAALLGLARDAVFRWTDVDGRLRAVKVLALHA